MKYQLIVFDWNGTLYNARATGVSRRHATIAPLFLGVQSVLDALQGQGFWLALATAEARLTLMQQIDHYQLSPYFSAIRTGSDGLSKPHPEVLWDILDWVGGSPATTLMVGDTVNDLQLAANAGVDALAVTYGLQTQQDLAPYHPVGYLNDIRHLPKWLGSVDISLG